MTRPSGFPYHDPIGTDCFVIKHAIRLMSNTVFLGGVSSDKLVLEMRIGKWSRWGHPDEIVP